MKDQCTSRLTEDTGDISWSVRTSYRNDWSAPTMYLPADDNNLGNKINFDMDLNFCSIFYRC